MADPFYRYEDDDQNVHLVDGLDKVPRKFRARAERVDLDGATSVLPADDPKVRSDDVGSVGERWVGDDRAPARSESFLGSVDAPSFLLGVAAAFALSFLFSMFRRGRSALFFRGLFILLAGGFISLAYLGWLYRSSGLGHRTFATPGQVVEEAQKGSEQFQERLRERERTLRALEESDR